MSECEKPKANSGVLFVGQSESLKSWLSWLRGYYVDRGLNFRDVRKHALSEFGFLADDYDFRAILDLYIHTRYYENIQDECGVANDDRYNGLVCRTDTCRYCNPASSFNYHYPTIKQHPMAVFKGYRITAVGYFRHDDMVSRLRAGCPKK